MSDLYGYSHTRRSRVAAVLAAATLLLAGCAGGGGRLEAPRHGTQDVNPQDPATLRDGGDLRIPLDNLPTNYNYNHVDGHENATQSVLAALMPQVFEDAPDGTQRLNTDVVTSAQLVSTNPQVVHYRINDRAVWSNGRPIDWEDFAAQVRASSAANQAYQVGDKSGYADVAKVDRGETDKDVLVTFAHPYSEWQQLFYLLYPKETNNDPAVFNTGWLLAPRETAGPFKVGVVDRTAKTLTLVRNERWWGAKPKLDRVIFTVTERRARADRLANNEIDTYEIGSDVDLFRRAQGIPGVRIRQAIPKQYPHLTFNGAPGAVLSDLRLRQAIARGVDRKAVAQRLVGQIVPNLVPMGNHIYPVGSKGYRDNTAFPFDQAAANAELDALGWVRPAPGAVRAKDGRPLRLRMVVPAGNPPSDATSKTVLDQLGQIGVQVVIEAVPPNAFFDEFVNRGNFDLTTFQWVSSSASFSNSLNVYQSPKGNDTGQNFSRIWDPRIDELYRQGFAELDDNKRIEIGNEIDKLIWQEVHNIPLYPQTGAFAVREKLANFGAKGLGDWDYIRAGWMN
ncbi:ABC transporter family substrate-binding protein [Pseudonocardia eucalypti]|uniref:ABC transporter family substrate-binding protein n=1 Tax=Pseudonocardia eucalypti TaxID=648755 RepID=A0ABP9QAM8_9PSEU|nr:peptide/nickel transport system substrate-binding protein [Pseudonocardia eucalypti]